MVAAGSGAHTIVGHLDIYFELLSHVSLQTTQWYRYHLLFSLCKQRNWK